MKLLELIYHAYFKGYKFHFNYPPPKKKSFIDVFFLITIIFMCQF